MHLVDHIFILLLFVLQPVYGYFEAGRYEALAKAGQPLDRIRFYRDTALVEWIFLAALGTAWFLLDRPLDALGLVSPGGLGFWGGLGLLILVVGLLLYSWHSAKKVSDSEKSRQANALGRVVRFLPHTTRELRAFVGVSITAGIVEEIVYRGFAIWYLAWFMPVWVAVAVSSVAFGLGHSYQGANGALRAGLLGLAFAIYYIGTGSIWLPIVAHVLLDALQGVAILEILRKDSESLKPEPA